MKRALVLLCAVFTFCFQIQPSSDSVANSDKERSCQFEASPADKLLRTIRAHGVQFIDVTWTDILGGLKEITLPVSRLESAFENGLFFDGSSIAGFTQIFESDLRLKIDLGSFSLSPWNAGEMACGRFFCDVLDSDGNPYPNDPRGCLKRIVSRAHEMGYSCLCGVELEFFLFKKDKGGSLQPLDKSGYCDAGESAEIKAFTQMLLYALGHLGLEVEKVHHEVANGQFEVVLSCCDPVTLADRIQLAKHAIKTFARQHSMVATFMPKPLNGVNGTGMHIHASLQKDGINAFFDAEKESFLSNEARSFITGILERAPEINVLFNAEVNSSKRLVPGYEAPVFLCCGNKNRSAAIRIPEVTRENIEKNNGAAVRIELRWPDASCNPYLALAGLFYAGLTGIHESAAHTPFINENLYHISQEEIAERGIQTLPRSLGKALEGFSKSSFARELLGDPLHAAYLEKKQKEWLHYCATLSQTITAWERSQGM